MKILQINKFFYLKGGSERHMFDVSAVLREHGHEVMEFSMDDEKNRESRFTKYFARHLDMHKLSIKNIFKMFYNVDAEIKLEKLIKDNKPDIAHLHNFVYQLGPAVIEVLKRHKIPIVMTLHDYRHICPNYMLFTKGKVCERCRGGKYYHCAINECAHNSYLKSTLAAAHDYVNNNWRKMYNDIDMFIAPSEYMKSVSIKFGIPKEKIIMVRNFLNNKLETGDNGISKNYILYFGRLSVEKGVGVLIKAMSKVKTGIKLKIIGTGPEEKKLKALAGKNGVENKVEFLGYKTGEELWNYVREAKAVVIPSLWPENMPYSLIEALSLGTPVIASKIGGLGELIIERKNGWLVEPGNAAVLAKRIDKLEQIELELIRELVKKSVRHFSGQNYYGEIIDIYKKLKSK